MKRCYNYLLLILVLINFETYAQEGRNKTSLFRDSLDHAIDISNFLLDKKGFLLIPTIITEPAVGYGLAGAAVYFHSSYSAKKGPPSMTGILGGGTENGTWLAGAFHIGYWNRDRIRYMGAYIRTYANLGFYGSGNVGFTDDESVNLNLDASVLIQQIKFRLGASDLFLGGRYLYMNTDNTFEIPVELPEYEGTEFSSALSEATLVINYDSRNNIFTPTKGFFIELSGTYSDEWMGGDDLYGRLSARLIGYLPANERLVLGIRHESSYTFGDVPFYARPIVFLRGVPLMKYQNKNTTVMEVEANWNVYRRWNLIGFTGIGNAFSDFGSFDEGKSISSVGTGFRYLVARKFGAQAGMDFAKSPEDFAIYIVFGCSWLR
ncbi:MAG: BamA/TamA family outer membrane protein [Lentimicrobium sp.]